MASFFLSRIDSLIDPLLEANEAKGGDVAKLSGKAQGQVAIASAKVAYKTYQEIFTGSRFKASQTTALARSDCSGQVPAQKAPSTPIRSMLSHS